MRLLALLYYRESLHIIQPFSLTFAALPAFERVNSTQANIKLVASEQFNGFAETVCQFAFLSDPEVIKRDSMVILCDFDILERGVKTKQQRYPAQNLRYGRTGVVLCGDKVSLKLNEFLGSELIYRASVKPSVIGAHLPFRDFPDYKYH